MNLTHIKGFADEIDWLSSIKKPIVCISDRCITIRGTHYIYANGHSAPIQIENDWSVTSSQEVEYTNL